MEKPKPLGKWTRWHIAHDPRWTKRCLPSSLGPMLSSGELVPLEPTLRAYGEYLYDESAVDKFFADLDRRDAEAPARAAARRLAAQEEAVRKHEREMAELRRQQAVSDALQASYEESVQAVEEHRERVHRTGMY